MSIVKKALNSTKQAWRRLKDNIGSLVISPLTYPMTSCTILFKLISALSHVVLFREAERVYCHCEEHSDVAIY